MKLINRDCLKKKISENISGDLENNNIFGASVFVSQNGETVYRDFFGGNKENSLFRLASMTKPIISAAMGILCDRGLISLEDDIEAYVGNFKNRDIVETDGDGNIVKTVKSANKVKIRHLLTHSGGIYDKDK